MARDLIIVARHDVGLFDYIQRSFHHRPDVEVVIDRRHDASSPPGPGDDRRTHRIDGDLRDIGFVVVPGWMRERATEVGVGEGTAPEGGGQG
jgi:hypothetical protein